MTQPPVSVIVPTRNSARTLDRLLESIRQQTVPVELIVVDNASTDGTRKIAEEHADIVRDAGPERSAQRNRGVAEARCDYVLLVDSDMILEPQTVGECLQVAKQTRAAAVVVPESTIGAGRLARIRALERSCYEGDDTIEAARFFRRDAFVAYRGYDEELWGPEDWDLPQRMRRGGERFARASRARLLHDESALTLWTHLYKKYYYGQSLAKYARRHPALAARQAVPIRFAFVRHWRQLTADPALGAGVIALKIAELAAGATGVLAVAAARAVTRHREGQHTGT